MQSLTWLDVLAGNIGAAFLIAGILFAWRIWRVERQGFALFCCWVLCLLALSIFTYRAGCWSDSWDCAVERIKVDAEGNVIN
jgi:hypothetical protein